MPPIDAIVALIWVVLLTPITIVLSYFGFVVGGRQDREPHRTARETTASSSDAQSTS
jgi:hypothetical protein